jgi:uncharacterized membrane protein YphA (DoxX/SURF4 family)
MHPRPHVDYVAESGDQVAALEFLLAVVTQPVNAALLGGGGLAAGVATVGYLRYRPLARDIAVFRTTVSSYRDLLPWLLRLGFGLPLVGAGFSGYFFSPAVEQFVPLVFAPTRLFGIGLGMLLLFGLATRTAALVGLAAYLLALPFEPRLLLANEYVPGLLAVAIVGGGRPSADHVLATLAATEGTLYGELDPLHRLANWAALRVAPLERHVPTIVRVGLGLNFVYLGLVEKLLAPGRALSVVAKYDLTAVVPVDPGLWVVGAGLAEVALGIVLVAGLFTRGAALVALGAFVVTLFGLPDDPVLAHVTLFSLASTLIITGSGPHAVDRVLGTTD